MWYIGTDDPADAQVLKEKIDGHLKNLNDDYRVERIAALKEVLVEVVPLDVFHSWMRKQGKEGGQHKFPRVIKHQRLADWQEHLKASKLQQTT